MTQLHGLEKFQITLVPAGTTPSSPPTNPIAIQNVMGKMPVVDGDRNYVGGNTGTFVANTGASRKSSEGGKVPITWDNMTWNDLALFHEIVAEGGITPTGANPYTWIADGQETADDLARLSIQAGGSEGKLQMLNGIVGKATLEGDAKTGAVKSTLDIMGSAPTVIGSFVTPVAYTPGNAIPFGQLVEVFADDTAGGLGTTALECAAIKGFKLTFDNKVSYVDTTCGRQYGRSKRYVELQLRVLLSAITWAEVQEQIGNVKRYVQLFVPDAASPTYSHTFNIAGYWKPYVWGEDGPFRDVTLTMWSEMDATLGYDWESTVINSLASAPNYQS